MKIARLTLIKDIILEKDTFTIKTNTETLNFRIDEDKLYFLDENNNELEITTKGNEVTIKDTKYAEYKIIISKNYPGITVIRNNRNFNFYFTDSGVKILGSGGRITEPIIADTFKPLVGLELLASSRGYIWGRTLPMLKKYIIVGSGPDNYPIAFPQDDLLAKSYALNDPNMVVDKPHNLYLQTSTNTGLISLLSLLVLLGIYLINSFKLYSKITFDSLEKYLGASCVIGIIGYFAAAMFNDSVVSVAPIFWIILGIGININIRLKRKSSEL